MKTFLHVFRNGSLFLDQELDLDDEQLDVALKCDTIRDGKCTYYIEKKVYDVSRKIVIFIADEDKKEYDDD